MPFVDELGGGGYPPPPLPPRKPPIQFTPGGANPLAGFSDWLAAFFGRSPQEMGYQANSPRLQTKEAQNQALRDTFAQEMQATQGAGATGTPEGFMKGYGGTTKATTARPSGGISFAKPTDLVLDPEKGTMVSRAVLETKNALNTATGATGGKAVPAAAAAAYAASQGYGAGTTAAAGGGKTAGGAPATAKAPVAPAATGWEEEFYRTHGRFPSEWDFSDKMWSEDMARSTGRAPTRADWVAHALENRFNPERPATSEFAPGWGLDTGYGPYRPAPMGAVPETVQLAGPISVLGNKTAAPGQRFEKATGPPRGPAPTGATPTQEREPGQWGQPIPASWDIATGDQIYGQWLSEGGSGDVGEWIDHIIAIGAAG